MFLPNQSAEEWLTVASKLPMAPAIFSRLSDLLSRPSTTLEDVVTTVQLDPILTARVVRVANSPLYQRGEPVVSITDAIAYIGTQETSQIVGVLVADKLFAQDLPHYKTSCDALWNGCVASAISARVIAGRVGLAEGECYTISLLRGIGWLVLEGFAQNHDLPISSLQFNDPVIIAKWEREVFGMTAADTTLRILNLWNLSPVAIASLRRLEKKPYRDPMTALLAVANAVVDRLGIGLEIERGRWAITPVELKVIGLDPAQMDEIIHEVKFELEKMRKIVGEVVGAEPLVP